MYKADGDEYLRRLAVIKCCRDSKEMEAELPLGGNFPDAIC